MYFQFPTKTLSPLLILHTNITRQNVRVLHTLGHVGMSCAVVQHDTFHQATIPGCLVFHLHQLDHVEVDFLAWDVNGKQGVHAYLSDKTQDKIKQD